MSSTAVAAMTHSNVDAAIMTDPALGILLEKMPDLKILADTRTAAGTREVFGVDEYPSVVLYSTANWLASHREEARHMAHAGLRTMDWLRSSSPSQIRDRLPAQFRTGDETVDMAGIEALKAMLSRDGKLNLDAAAAVCKVLSVSIDNVRTANINLADTFTNEFAQN
jgi:NitT/TauT family transport system substrate-binding protein